MAVTGINGGSYMGRTALIPCVGSGTNKAFGISQKLRDHGGHLASRRGAVPELDVLGIALLANISRFFFF